MNDNELSKQRESGIKLINEYIREEAQKNGLTISNIIWDDGHQRRPSFSDHSLIIESGQNKIEVTLPDDAVADFPSLVGNAKTKALVRAAVISLNKH